MVSDMKPINESSHAKMVLLCTIIFTILKIVLL